MQRRGTSGAGSQVVRAEGGRIGQGFGVGGRAIVVCVLGLLVVQGVPGVAGQEGRARAQAEREERARQAEREGPAQRRARMQMQMRAQVQLGAQAIQVVPAQVQVRIGGSGFGPGSGASPILDRRTLRMLSAARERIEEERWSEATAILQAILDLPEDSFYEDGEGRFRSLRSAANELIGGLPAEGRRSYTLQFGPLAEELLRAAGTSGDPERLAEVATRYYHTAAGFEALARLAAQHFDHGHFPTAALAYERLFSHPLAPRPPSAMLHFRAAAAWACTGEAERARLHVQAGLATEGGRAQWSVLSSQWSAGEGGDPEAWLASLAPLGVNGGPGVSRRRDNWLVYRGDASRTGSMAGDAPLLRAEWEYSVEPPELVREFFAALEEEAGEQGLALHVASHPLAIDGRVLVRTVDELVALDSGTGAVLWRVASEPSIEAMLAEEFMQQNQHLQMLVAMGVLSRAFRDSVYGTLSSDGRSVFVIQDVGLVPAQAITINVNGQDRTLGGPASYNRLAAYDLETGDLRWSVGGEPYPAADPGEGVEATGAAGAGARAAQAVEEEKPEDEAAERSGEGRDRQRGGDEAADGVAEEDVEIEVEVNAAEQEVVEEGWAGNAAALAADGLGEGASVRASVEWDALRGMFFFGAPLPMGGRLYVLGEMHSELRLVALDAQDGRLLWWQTLARMGQKVENDPGRRMQALPVAYADGILLCPACASGGGSSGMVVAVDVASHSLLWAYRYETTEGVAGNMHPSQLVAEAAGSVQSAWMDAAPLVRGGRVVIAPPGSPELHCLNLADGTPEWTVGREGGLYPAGVFGDTVVVVGERVVRALGLEDGRERWSTEIARPTGLGFVMGNRYVTASLGGRVATIDLESGAVATARASDERVLGNLLAHGESVVSVTASGVRSFAQVGAVRRRVEELLARNPNDPEGLLAQGELELQSGDLEAAAEALRRAYAVAPDEAKRAVFVQVLLAMLERDFGRYESVRAELEVLLSSDAERSDYLQRVAVGLRAAGRVGEAVDACFALLELDEHATIVVNESPPATVRADRWVQGQMADLLSQAAPELRAAVGARVADGWLEARAGELERMRRFARCFGSLDIEAASWSGTEARFELSRRLAEEGHLVEAELELLGLAGSGEAETAGRALLELARLLERSGRPGDAAAYYAMLGEEYEDVAVQGERTGDEVAEEEARRLEEAGLLGGHRRDAGASGDVWPPGAPEVEEEERPGRGVTSYLVALEEAVVTPVFRGQQVRVDVQTRELVLYDAAEGREHRAALGDVQYDQQFTRAQTMGHYVLLLAGTRVHAIDMLGAGAPGEGDHGRDARATSQSSMISTAVEEGDHGRDARATGVDAGDSGRTPADGAAAAAGEAGPTEARVLWSHETHRTSGPLASWFGGAQQMVIGGARLGGMLQGRMQFVRLDQFGRYVGLLGPVTPGLVAFVERNRLVAVDPVTGETLWVRAGVETNGSVFGDGEYVVFIHRNNARASVVRGADGALVAERDLPAPSDRFLEVHGRAVLLDRRHSGGESPGLRMYDVATGEDVWEYSITADDYWTFPIDANRHGVLSATRGANRVEIVGLEDGRTLFAADLPSRPDMLQGVFVLEDAERYYFALTSGARNDNRLIVQPLMNGWREPVMNGVLYAFDRARGELVWSRPMEQQVLPLDQPTGVPVFLLYYRRYEQLDNQRGYQHTGVFECLDRRTGEIVAHEEAQDMIAQYVMRASAEEGWIEVEMPNRTYRLVYGREE